MYKRKDNLKQMEKRVQMNLDSSKDTEMSDRKREKVAETPKQKDMEMSEVWSKLPLNLLFHNILDYSLYLHSYNQGFCELSFRRYNS